MSGVNVNRLKGKLVERGLTVTDLARMINVDRTTLYRKLTDGGAGILVREANAIATVLELTESEAMSIFFSQYVALYATPTQRHRR